MGANAIEQKRNNMERQWQKSGIFRHCWSVLDPQIFLPNLGAMGSNPVGRTTNRPKAPRSGVRRNSQKEV